MADTDSVLSVTTGTEQDDPLADLTDEQLNQFVEDTVYVYFMLQNRVSVCIFFMISLF